jgi:hypothetical protein
MAAIFLITTLKMVDTLFSIGTRESLVQRTNGGGTSRTIIGSLGHKFGIHFGLVKRPLSFGLFSIRLSRPMNGEPALRWPPSPSNVCFASLANTSESVKH